MSPANSMAGGNASPKRARIGPTRGEMTRARLVDAAIDEFAAVGFHDAKVSNIVAKAQLTQPTFYLYFKSKDEIYRYLIKRVHDEVLMLVERSRLPAHLPTADVRERLRFSVELFLQYFADNPRLATIGYFSGEASNTIRQEVTVLNACNIAFEQGAGYFRRDLDPEFIAHCYNGTLERVIKTYILNGNGNVRELSEKVVEIYNSGLLSPDLRQSSDIDRRTGR